MLPVNMVLVKMLPVSKMQNVNLWSPCMLEFVMEIIKQTLYGNVSAPFVEIHINAKWSVKMLVRMLCYIKHALGWMVKHKQVVTSELHIIKFLTPATQKILLLLSRIISFKNLLKFTMNATSGVGKDLTVTRLQKINFWSPCFTNL